MTGKELKKKRKLMGWTQAELADKSGIPLGTIGRIESTDLRIKDVEKLEIFAAIFNNEENNRIVTLKEKFDKPLINNGGNSGFNDIKQFNQHATYTENSTFPDKAKAPPNDLIQIINNLQQQNDLLYKHNQLLKEQVGLLNKYLPSQ